MSVCVPSGPSVQGQNSTANKAKSQLVKAQARFRKAFVGPVLMAA